MSCYFQARIIRYVYFARKEQYSVDRLQSNALYLRNPPLLPRELSVITEKIETLLGKLQGSVTCHPQSTRVRTISTSSSSNSEEKKLKVNKDLASTENRTRSLGAGADTRGVA